MVLRCPERERRDGVEISELKRRDGLEVSREGKQGWC